MLTGVDGSLSEQTFSQRRNQFFATAGPENGTSELFWMYSLQKIVSGIENSDFGENIEETD